MVVDTSAIATILFAEDEAERFSEAIVGDPLRLISAGTALECSLVIEGELGEAGGRELDLLFLRVGIEIIPFKETRNYVKKVLRNYVIYKTLYGAGGIHDFQGILTVRKD
ncbi:MAG: hypothetical protein IIA63_00215 [Nitrospinae bacterium]|nr:hypothetical protein [Nitrospinota bacterium]